MEREIEGVVDGVMSWVLLSVAGAAVLGFTMGWMFATGDAEVARAKADDECAMRVEACSERTGLLLEIVNACALHVERAP